MGSAGNATGNESSQAAQPWKGTDGPNTHVIEWKRPWEQVARQGTQGRCSLKGGTTVTVRTLVLVRDLGGELKQVT